MLWKGQNRMKFELGDKVHISNYWKKVDRDAWLEKQGINDLEKHLASDEMAGDILWINKYEIEPVDEVGYVVGIRSLKTSYTLSYVVEDSLDVGVGIMPGYEGIRQQDAFSQKVYLVATKMNCIRRVNFEDMTYIPVESEGS